MAEMVRIAEIAKRLRVDLTTVRRLIAKESDALQLALHRGKNDRLFLSREDAGKLIASYEAAVRLLLPRKVATQRRTTDTGTSISSSWFPRRCRIG
jgi:hypothetical protein